MSNIRVLIVILIEYLVVRMINLTENKRTCNIRNAHYINTVFCYLYLGEFFFL